MASKKILVQTTIPYTEDDWHVGRFSLLMQELERVRGGDGPAYQVVGRNREPDKNGDDAVLSHLGESDFDELWLMAVDDGEGLTPSDAAGILKFRQRGGGVFTARDHDDLGSCLCELGSLGVVNHFHSHNPEPDVDRLVNDDQDNPNIGFPNYHSGANGDYQRAAATQPVHELLRSERSPSGVIESFPAHPHEGAVGVPVDMSYARVIATGTSKITGRPFNLAVAIDGEPFENGGSLGRAMAVSSFHHFVDMNWDLGKGCPSFVTDKPGREIEADPSRLEIFKDYVSNIARWLAN